MEAILGSGALLFVLGFFALIGAVMFRNLLFICGPNEVLIFSGSTRTTAGRKFGYRVIKGGSAIRRPLIETVDRMDLTNMIIELSVTNAYSRGGIPLSVQGVANVKIAGTEPVLNNAVERFLAYDRKGIMQVAKDTLEGNLRGVLSQLTPEQVNEDKVAFEEKLQEEAEHDLTRLGLTLDTLRIQNVSDEKNYLNSIGRKQSAELITRSRIAEATAKTKSITQDAANRQAARISAIEADIEVARAETARRLKDTLSRRDAMVAEEVGKVKAQVAKAESELRVQEARIEQARRQLEADVVAPAQANMERRISEAKGAASKVVEDGKATTEVLRQMIKTWKSGGSAARDIFVMQKLQPLLGQLTATIQTAKVARLTILPSDSTLTARNAVSLSEEVRGTLGVDVPALIEGAVRK